MDSSVRSLANHYDTLMVGRTASSAEITQAFASAMLTARMRPDNNVARLAKLSVAYETLRDPAKRRAYDSSLGLGSRPAAAPLRTATPFIGMSINRLNRLADASPEPVQPVPVPAPAPNKPQPPAEAPHVEPRVAGFIASSLRQPVPRPEPEPQPAPPPQQAQARPQMAEPDRVFVALDESSIEDGRIAVGREAAMLGACVIGVAILSIALALPTPNPDRLPASPTPVRSAVTVPLPAAAVEQDSLAAPQASAKVAANRSHKVEARSAVDPLASAPAAQSAALDPLAPVGASNEQQTAAESSSLQGSTQEVASVAPPPADSADAAEESAPVAVAAKMPLPAATVARTIHRIGYSCGRVVSATGVGGAGGVFKVTCSSGDSYQATPVHGRYHFRRWASH